MTPSLGADLHHRFEHFAMTARFSAGPRQPVRGSRDDAIADLNRRFDDFAMTPRVLHRLRGVAWTDRARRGRPRVAISPLPAGWSRRDARN